MAAVSIIIPTHDRGHELAEALASVRAQQFQDWEALVVDDNSSEDIAAVVVAAGDARIRHVPLPAPRRRAPAGRNFGVETTSGEFVLFLDSDDLLDPACLERRVALLRQRPDLDAVIFACQQFRDRPGDLPLLWNELGGASEDDLDRYLRRDVVWQTSSPLWRRSGLAKVGPWDETCLSGQDWEFHVRALLAGVRYEKVNQVDHYWRIPTGQRYSLGRLADVEKGYPRAWVQTLDRIWLRFVEAGRADRQTLGRFAALYFNAARQVASTAGRREARRVWRLAYRRGVISEIQFIEGWIYWFGQRWPRLRLRLDRYLARRWPAELLAPGSGTFLKTRPKDGPPPRVSVVMAVHNGERYLEEAVQSITRQTFRDLELLICDDGSTDATPAILQRLATADGRIRIFRPGRIGFVNALNLLHEHAQGELVARMDGDDVSKPERIEKQVAYLDVHPEVVLLGAQCQDIDPAGMDLIFYPFPTDHAAIESELLNGHGGVIRHPAAMYRRAAFEKAGGYRNRWEWIEDLDLFLRLMKLGKAANLDEVLLRYRIHPKSTNHLRQQEQIQKKRALIAEARAERGLPPVGDSLNLTVPDAADVQFERWGWRALKAGRIDVAREHALSLLRLRPLSMASWRLALCAVRGR